MNRLLILWCGLLLTACHRDTLEIQRVFSFRMVMEAPAEIVKGTTQPIDVEVVPEGITTSTTFRMRWQGLTRLPGQLTVGGQIIAPGVDWTLNGLQPDVRFRADSAGQYQLRFSFFNEQAVRRDTTLSITAY